MASTPQAQVRLWKAPNLDMHDKLIKRGLHVVWGGWRGQVQRVRTGRCLVCFWHPDKRDVRWLPCSSVYVVPA